MQKTKIDNFEKYYMHCQPNIYIVRPLEVMQTKKNKAINLTKFITTKITQTSAFIKL